MIALGTRIQRYIFRRCLLALFVVVTLQSLTIMLVDLVEQMRTLGARADIDLQTALLLSSMKLPLLIELTLPFAVLTAVILTFFQLSRRAELPVIRASGLSAWRFVAPAALMAGLMGLLTTTALNPVGAGLSKRYEQTRSALLGSAAGGANTGIWLRDVDNDRQTYIHATNVSDDGGTLLDVRIVEQDRLYENGTPTDRFTVTRRIDAERARLLNGFWQLDGVVERPLNGMAMPHASMAIASSLAPDTLISKFASPNTIGFWDLPGHVGEARRAGLESQRYWMRWHQLVASPALFVAMALIGALSGLQLARLGGTARAISVSLAAAIVLFFVAQLGAGLGGARAMPPAIAAWLPPLFAILSALTFLAYREDG